MEYPMKKIQFSIYVLKTTFKNWVNLVLSWLDLSWVEMCTTPPRALFTQTAQPEYAHACLGEAAKLEKTNFYSGRKNKHLWKIKKMSFNIKTEVNWEEETCLAANWEQCGFFIWPYDFYRWNNWINTWSQICCQAFYRRRQRSNFRNQAYARHWSFEWCWYSIHLDTIQVLFCDRKWLCILYAKS